jgi:hypothetical protein
MSQTFLENVVLLILTASLTGFLVPYVLKRIDARKAQEQKDIDARKQREQKAFEAELARQSKVIEAQIQVLGSLAKQCWEFQLLALTVSYYKLNGSEERYHEALQDYESKAWNLFGSIRIDISSARRLTSDDIYQSLLKFYHDQLIRMDSGLMALVRDNAVRSAWQDYHRGLQSSGEKTDEVLNRLADALRLSPPDQ